MKKAKNTCYKKSWAFTTLKINDNNNKLYYQKFQNLQLKQKKPKNFFKAYSHLDKEREKERLKENRSR